MYAHTHTHPRFLCLQHINLFEVKHKIKTANSVRTWRQCVPRTYKVTVNSASSLELFTQPTPRMGALNGTEWKCFPQKETFKRKTGLHNIYQSQILTVWNMDAEDGRVDLVSESKDSVRRVCRQVHRVDGCLLTTELPITPESRKRQWVGRAQSTPGSSPDPSLH